MKERRPAEMTDEEIRAHLATLNEADPSGMSALGWAVGAARGFGGLTGDDCDEQHRRKEQSDEQANP
jgi:hypothetical protein